MPKGRRAKRERITIQAAVTEDGNYGQKKVTAWVDVEGLIDVPADFNHTGGTETFRGEQVQADVVAVFIIKQHPTPFGPTNRLVHKGKAYGIASVRPSMGPYESAHRDTLIFVKAKADG